MQKLNMRMLNQLECNIDVALFYSTSVFSWFGNLFTLFLELWIQFCVYYGMERISQCTSSVTNSPTWINLKHWYSNEIQQYSTCTAFNNTIPKQKYAKHFKHTRSLIKCNSLLSCILTCVQMGSLYIYTYREKDECAHWLCPCLGCTRGHYYRSGLRPAGTLCLSGTGACLSWTSWWTDPWDWRLPHSSQAPVCREHQIYITAIHILNSYDLV